VGQAVDSAHAVAPNSTAAHSRSTCPLIRPQGTVLGDPGKDGNVCVVWAGGGLVGGVFLVQVRDSEMMVAAQGGALQLIVLDHADFSDEWFQDSVVQRWRDGDALIPEE
jgi:hypothetical protein